MKIKEESIKRSNGYRQNQDFRLEVTGSLPLYSEIQVYRELAWSNGWELDMENPCLSPHLVMKLG